MISAASINNFRKKQYCCSSDDCQAVVG